MSESTMSVDKWGNKIWRNSKGESHRTDGPAVVWSTGRKEWYVDGRRHRIDGPADEYSNGTKAWCINGNYHRTDGPAVEHSSGGKEWYVNGECLGENDSGFWALWDRLSNEDRANPTLLTYLPEKF